MVPFYVDIFGYIGGFLIGILLIPQIIHTYKTKDSKGLSYLFLTLGCLADLFMLIYGFFIESAPLISANFLNLFCNIVLIGMKYMYDKE